MENENTIKKESIINGFYKNGISLPQNGSKDEELNIPETIINNYNINDEIENKIKKKIS